MKGGRGGTDGGGREIGIEKERTQAQAQARA